MVTRTAAAHLDDDAGFGERLLHQLGIGDLFGDPARKQICLRSPRLQRGFLAGRRYIGIMEAGGGTEDFQIRHYGKTTVRTPPFLPPSFPAARQRNLSVAPINFRSSREELAFACPA